MGSLEQASKLELTPEIFHDLLQHEEFQQILRDLDVEDEEQHDLFDTLDVDGGGTLDLEELISGIAKLRGEARRSDIISVGLRVRSTQDELQAFMESTSEQLRSQSENLEDLLEFLSKACPSFLLSSAAC